ncbi:hypothetical protein WUBG_08053 [Wuchereria bancrofti]|uniref:Uncharacterized protein n=1 Tax=Wuchereria bancrofti TaxID=6293 RepID=J9EFY7_WUCBA|nr:hypothetical protein WUBG_08053 [Wuchereria bancrofti]
MRRNHRLSVSPTDNSSCVVDLFEGQMLLVAGTRRKPVLYDLSADDQKWLLLVVMRLGMATKSPKLGHSSISLTLHFSSIEYLYFHIMHKSHGDSFPRSSKKLSPEQEIGIRRSRMLFSVVQY